MLFSLSIISIFAFISVYFFFQAESLNRKLVLANKDVKAIKKEKKETSDALRIIANKNQKFIQSRFEKLKEKNSNNEDFQLLNIMVNNYGTIFLESLKERGRLHKISKKCFENSEQGSYKNLITYIATQEQEIKSLWGSNNISGYISFVEVLLMEYENPNKP